MSRSQHARLLACAPLTLGLPLQPRQTRRVRRVTVVPTCILPPADLPPRQVESVPLFLIVPRPSTSLIIRSPPSPSAPQTPTAHRPSLHPLRLGDYSTVRSSLRSRCRERICMSSSLSLSAPSASERPHPIPAPPTAVPPRESYTPSPAHSLAQAREILIRWRKGKTKGDRAERARKIWVDARWQG